jgi:hypothetical protein
MERHRVFAIFAISADVAFKNPENCGEKPSHFGGNFFAKVFLPLPPRPKPEELLNNFTYSRKHASTQLNQTIIGIPLARNT